MYALTNVAEVGDRQHREHHDRQDTGSSSRCINDPLGVGVEIVLHVRLLKAEWTDDNVPVTQLSYNWHIVLLINLFVKI